MTDREVRSDRLESYGVSVVGPFRDPDLPFPERPCELPETCRHVMTRPDPSGRQWQLDYVLSNLPEERFRTWVLPIDGDFSDHAPIIVDLLPDADGSIRPGV